MTTEIKHHRAIVETRDNDDGTRSHRVEWSYGDGVADSYWALEPQPVDRAIVLDRWDGYMAPNGDAGKHWLKLDNAIHGIAEALTRRDLDDPLVIDGEIVDVGFVIDTDGLEAVIKDWLIERAVKVAR